MNSDMESLVVVAIPAAFAILAILTLLGLLF